ncbi:protein O-mannosyl-transferase [Gammaproteobacteria bacterium]
MRPAKAGLMLLRRIMRCSLPSYGLTGVQVGVLALFAFLAYLPSLDGSFVFDDLGNIVINSEIHATNLSTALGALWSTSYPTRPLVMFSFALNHWAGGLDSFGYHLVNLLLHIINAVLLLWLIRWLTETLPISDTGALRQREQLAFWGAALWALNPVQVHAVTYVVQRMTVLATVFYLLAMMVHIQYRRGRLSWRVAVPLILLCFLLGLASKEIVVTLPFALLLIEVVFLGSLSRRTMAWLSAGALVMLLMLGWFYLASHWPDPFTTFPNRDFSPWERVLTETRVLWYYLSAFFLPLPERLSLSHEQYPLSHSPWDPPVTLLAMLGWIGLTMLAWRLRRTRPFFAFAVFFYLLASSPEASFVNLELAFIHRLYLPSLFLAAGFLTLLPPSLVVRGMLPLILIILLTIATQQRNEVWVTEARVWQSDRNHGDKTLRNTLNLSIGLQNLEQTEEAIPLLDQILPQATGLDRLRVLLQLGSAHYYRHRCDQALPSLETLHHEFGAWNEARFLQGLCLSQLGREEEAHIIADELAHSPMGQEQGVVLKAQLARRQGDLTQAHHLLTKALEAVTARDGATRTLLQLHLANLELAEQRPQAAYQRYLQVITDTPDNYFAWNQIYRMQMAANDLENAKKIRRFLESRGVRVSD